MVEPNLRPIGSVPRAALDRLFDEESEMWSDRLHWSFEPTRKRLQTALLEGTLNGFVSVDPTGASAYATYALDEGRGVIGSFFSSQRSRSTGIEDALVSRVLSRLADFRPKVIDCQTLFSSKPDLKEPFAAHGFESARRRYMTISRDDWQSARRPLRREAALSHSIRRSDLKGLAHLIFEAHEPSRTSDASSSFDTLDSCDRILRQIMIDEVCGPFDSFSSRLVERNGRTIAATLVTWPLRGIGHVSEVATSPEHRRRGLARQCLIEALGSVFEQAETRAATLSVTSSNHAAIALYESLGFKTHLEYESHVLRRPR